MTSKIKLSIGQYSDRGRKEINQDFHGVYIPKEPQLSSKGIAIVLADGISSSQVSQIASEAAVSGFLEDYYCTSEAWSVKKSARQVLAATNSWLHAQTRQSQYRFDMDRGYVCTLSAMIIKSTTAHIFHVGDTRIYRLRDRYLEQLTQDHRFWASQDQSYLSRAMGMKPQLEIDYQALQVEKGDVFLFITDGVYDYMPAQLIVERLQNKAEDTDAVAKRIAQEALDRGSDDNLTVQIVRVNELPRHDPEETVRQSAVLPIPPVLEPRMQFDGYKIIREIHASSRSHVYLALDETTESQVVIKTPSIDLREDNAYLERFLMEEWIARRIDSPHVLKHCMFERKRNYLYVVTEMVEGQTLAQWMIDHPRPELETVRSIVEQIAKGLRAFHRMEMLHQDLRPNNIMIDRTGTVKIIDFGSTRVAGIAELASPADQPPILGTAPYTAPEYFCGGQATSRSDLFSLGVITYHMLTGKLPYGTQVARIRTQAAQSKLQYRPIRDIMREIPPWVDEAIRKAVHPDPLKRYDALSEFIFDLRRPSQDFLKRRRPSLLERDPVAFWKTVSFVLFIVIFMLSIKFK